MNLTTPALLFPAISLLLLAYTNRFLVLAQPIRQLRSQENLTDVAIRQIANLRSRITMMRRMQARGVTSFIRCAVSMFLVFIDLCGGTAGTWNTHLMRAHIIMCVKSKPFHRRRE
jgi:hypothetical protein